MELRLHTTLCPQAAHCVPVRDQAERSAAAAQHHHPPSDRLRGEAARAQPLLLLRIPRQGGQRNKKISAKNKSLV